MPFLFLVSGIMFVVSAARGTEHDLIALLKGDFTGKGNFVYWTLAIIFIGSLGYISALEKPVRYFLALILVVMILKNGGVFQKFMNAINATQNQQIKGSSVTSAANSLPRLAPLTGVA